MKRVIVALSICVLMFGLTTTSHAAKAFDGKVGYVDLSRIFDEYEKTKSFDAVLEEGQQAFQEKRNQMIEAIRDKQSKLALLKEDEKAKLEQELEKDKQDLLEYDRQERAELTKQRDEKVREILLEIETVVRDFAEREKYSLILNDRVLIFGDDQYDLTTTVLKMLNDSYTKAKK